jgi:hypothetical protein
VPPTNTPVVPQLILALAGCNTGLDIRHRLGEVTNAYVRVQNTGRVDATDVCLRLEATDEAGAHPDQARCVPLLPAQTEVTLKLTVDTEYRADTAIAVYLTSLQGVAARVAGASCEGLDLPLLKEIEAELDLIVPLSSNQSGGRST